MADRSSLHPSAARHKVGSLRHFLGLCGAGVFWIAQMSLSETLSDYACYPRRAPLYAPLWNNLVPVLGVISLIALMGGLLSGYIAWTALRDSKTEAQGGNHQLIESGQGRARFISMLGALSSLMFLVAILFTGCALLLVAPCHGWAP